MFCVTGDVAFSSRGRDKPREGLWVLKIRRYQGAGTPGKDVLCCHCSQRDAAQCPPYPSLGWGTTREGERRSHRMKCIALKQDGGRVKSTSQLLIDFSSSLLILD